MGVPAGALRAVESGSACRKYEALGRHRHCELSARKIWRPKLTTFPCRSACATSRSRNLEPNPGTDLSGSSGSPLRFARSQHPRSGRDRREVDCARRKRRSTRLFRLLSRRRRIALAAVERQSHRQSLFFRCQPAPRRGLHDQSRRFGCALAFSRRRDDDSHESRRFEVDTTAPRIENLSAALEGGQIHVRFRAQDRFSTIKRAEFSVDAGDWTYVEPADSSPTRRLKITISKSPARIRRKRCGSRTRGRRARLRQIRQHGRRQDRVASEVARRANAFVRPLGATPRITATSAGADDVSGPNRDLRIRTCPKGLFRGAGSVARQWFFVRHSRTGWNPPAGSRISVRADRLFHSLFRRLTIFRQRRLAVAVRVGGGGNNGGTGGGNLSCNVMATGQRRQPQRICSVHQQQSLEHRHLCRAGRSELQHASSRIG